MKLKMGWSDRCCICGRNVTSYNNPEPLRSGELDCCNACNQLVCEARKRAYALEAKERDEYLSYLRELDYEALCIELQG